MRDMDWLTRNGMYMTSGFVGTTSVALHDRFDGEPVTLVLGDVKGNTQRFLFTLEQLQAMRIVLNAWAQQDPRIEWDIPAAAQAPAADSPARAGEE